MAFSSLVGYFGMILPAAAILFYVACLKYPESSLLFCISFASIMIICTILFNLFFIPSIYGKVYSDTASVDRFRLLDLRDSEHQFDSAVKTTLWISFFFIIGSLALFWRTSNYWYLYTAGYIFGALIVASLCLFFRQGTGSIIGIDYL